METKKEKLSDEIKNSLFQINEIVCYYQDDKQVRNRVCRELRKIHDRIDKLNAINKLLK